ncbi:Uncharacterised protein [Raoultella planticola]|uniref:Uncharacterized protein n=1 Tax=Raoultella planticola TaxID=575 RepID=A0A485B5D6_RAOPL|nr:Uncharacterised protein [Raoultella planticola]
MLDLIQVDWEGNITWKFDRYEQVSDPGHAPRWMARAHHDYQRAGIRWAITPRGLSRRLTAATP